MGASNRLRAADWQQLIRIIAELAEQPTAAARRDHALRSLQRMIGAECSLICRVGWEHGQYRMFEHQTVGIERYPASLIKAYFAGEIDIDPVAREIVKFDGTGVTGVRNDFVQDRQWYGSSHYQQYRRELGLDDGVYTKITTPRGQIFGMAFIRGKKDSRLTARHREILRVFSTNAMPTLRLDEMESLRNKLPPRLQLLAQCYMDGCSVKEAALRLGLSEHTVRDYTKSLHERLNVSSRGELLRALYRA